MPDYCEVVLKILKPRNSYYVNQQNQHNPPRPRCGRPHNLRPRVPRRPASARGVAQRGSVGSAPGIGYVRAGCSRCGGGGRVGGRCYVQVVRPRSGHTQAVTGVF